jgi:hypothetical protein
MSSTWQTAPSSARRTALSVIIPISGMNCRLLCPVVLRFCSSYICPRKTLFTCISVLVLVLILIITNPFKYISSIIILSLPPPLLNHVQLLSFFLLSDPDSRYYFLRHFLYHFLHKISSPSASGVRHGPVDKAPGCCKVALGSNPRPSTPKMGSSKVDEQPTGGPTKIRG